MTVPVGDGLQGWFPLTGLPWNLPAVPGICGGSPPTLDGTSSQAHQLAIILMTNMYNFAFFSMKDDSVLVDVMPFLTSRCELFHFKKSKNHLI